MDIFLNVLIQFYSNNVTSLHHLILHSRPIRRVAVQHRDRNATRDWAYCDVSSPCAVQKLLRRNLRAALGPNSACSISCGLVQLFDLL